MHDNKNILLATILSVVVLIGWTWFYEKPRIEKQEAQKKIQAQQEILVRQQNQASTDSVNSHPSKISAEKNIVHAPVHEASAALKTREEIISSSKNHRVEIKSEDLHGSINLQGARFDDITLAKYFTTPEKKEEVTLFAPSQSKERYFADFGWISSDASIDLPTPETLWKASDQKITPENPITLSWKNKNNIEFFIKISLDENYMFSVSQSLKNGSGKDIAIASYGRINRILNNVQKPIYILHEGPIGVFNDILHEISYKDLTEERQQDFTTNTPSWLGITDKYWLSGMLPDKNNIYSSSFSYASSNKNNFFSSEFTSQEFKVASGESLNFDHHLFAGAKKVGLLDEYSKKYDIKLFDRAVDFGWFYFLTKPFFFVVEFLYKLLGNFGLAILAMTVIVKLLLFPMANKSYAAIAKVKKLHPKIEEIRKKFKDDKPAMNREIMEFYKKQKVNPASGCLPVIIQIPIFFSLYKVLYVTLDMRHAPFYGWIHDLSAPDPTSIFNLFGLLPFEVSHSFVIGIWPILMGLTMIIQQKLNPVTTDPTQAKVLKYMPYFLTFVLAAFPAGLVIYWTWSNILSVLQQWIITKKMNSHKH